MSALPYEPGSVPTLLEIEEMLLDGDRDEYRSERDAATPFTVRAFADKWWALALLAQGSPMVSRGGR